MRHRSERTSANDGDRAQRVCARPRLLSSFVTILIVALLGSASSAGAQNSGEGRSIDFVPPEVADRAKAKKLKVGRQMAPSSRLTVAATEAAGASAALPRRMKLLVVSADGRSGAATTDLPAIKATLDQLGAPYDVFVATDRQLTRADLVDASGVGRYQGVILETGSLVYFDAG